MEEVVWKWMCEREAEPSRETIGEKARELFIKLRSAGSIVSKAEFAPSDDWLEKLCQKSAIARSALSSSSAVDQCPDGTLSAIGMVDVEENEAAPALKKKPIERTTEA